MECGLQESQVLGDQAMGRRRQPALQTGKRARYLVTRQWGGGSSQPSRQEAPHREPMLSAVTPEEQSQVTRVVWSLLEGPSYIQGCLLPHHLPVLSCAVPAWVQPNKHCAPQIRPPKAVTGANRSVYTLKG